MKKILIILIEVPWKEDAGGASHSVWNIAHYLQDRGLEISILAVANKKDQKSVNSISVTYVEPENTKKLPLKLYNHIKKDLHQYDYIHGDSWYMWGFSVMKILKKYRYKTVCDLRGPRHNKKDFNKRILKNIFRIIAFKTCDIIDVPSFFSKGLVQSVFYGNTNKIRVIPNGVNDSFLIDYDRTNKYIKKQEYIITYCGVLGSYKGFDLFLKTIAKVKDIIPVKALAIGPAGEKNLYKYKTLVNELGLQKIVDFKGKVPQKETVKYYKISDVLFVPTKGESFGKVFIEAGSLGVPVVSSNTTAIPEIVTNDYGVLCDYGDIDQYTNAIVNLLKDPLKRKAMGDYAVKHVAQNYTWDVAIDKLLEEVYV